MYKRRLILFAVAFTAGLIAILQLRAGSPGSGATASDRFWAAKTHLGAGSYDVVIVGDSRSVMGISPSAMQDQLPDLSILNFAYLGAGLTPELVGAALEKLDSSSETRMVVLGVTPLSLISTSLVNDHFRQEAGRLRGDWLSRLYLAPLRNAFEPFRPFAEVERPTASSSALLFREGGWLASDSPPAPPRIALQSYTQRFARATFDAPNFERLVARLTQASASGIEIFAFRHPSSRRMVELENQLSGFRESLVRKRLEEAGAVWLSFRSDAGRPLEFASYDGSHLGPDGARAFSAELAKQIASHR